MGDKKSGVTFLITLLMLFIIFFGLILIIFNTGGKLFLAEMILFISFLGLACVSCFGVYFNSRWGFSLLAIIYALILFDLLALYFFTRYINVVYFATVIVSAIAFITSISGIKQSKEEPEYITIPEPEKTTEFEPGKYLGSKTGTSYHAPKCDWAKKIRKENQAWYATEEAAEKAGLKKHSCLK